MRQARAPRRRDNLTHQDAHGIDPPDRRAGRFANGSAARLPARGREAHARTPRSWAPPPPRRRAERRPHSVLAARERSTTAMETPAPERRGERAQEPVAVAQPRAAAASAAHARALVPSSRGEEAAPRDRRRDGKDSYPTPRWHSRSAGQRNPDAAVSAARARDPRSPRCRQSPVNRRTERFLIRDS